MHKEIELKARITDPQALKLKLAAAGVSYGTYEKNDTYWKFPGERIHTLRVRQEKIDGNPAIALITHKTKEMRGGIEVNDEREVSVSDGKVFEEILKQMGLEPGIRKIKRGQAWKCAELNASEQVPPILAELSEVQDLGWFLELEIIAESDSEQIREQSQKRLLDLLDRLGIPAEQIETRPYTYMLEEKAGYQHN